MLNMFNTIALSYKSIILFFRYFSFYFLVGLRANQRLYQILGQSRPGGNIGRTLGNHAVMTG